MRVAPRAEVVSVSRESDHHFSKTVVQEIVLLAGLGVEGDAHAGSTVQHRSRVAADPTQPNLRQVHLIHSELFDELAAQGHPVGPGQLGENVTIRGIDLLGLPPGAVLHLGAQAVVRVTGLRNPCAQIEQFRSGLLSAVRVRDGHGDVVRKTGIMGVVVHGGRLRAGAAVTVDLAERPHRPLERV